MFDLINPKEITLFDRQGKERTYIISEIDCWTSQEIVARYAGSMLPKVGDFEITEQMAQKIMGYVAIPQKDKPPLRLQTVELIKNHVPDLRTLSALQIEMARYNWDFFLPEDLSSFWGRIKMVVTTWITEIMTDSLRQSSQAEKPLSTNSAQSTH
jgi:hypothetical protein